MFVYTDYELQKRRNKQELVRNESMVAMIADEKAARQKNHEKQCVFHGFLLFKWQK